MAEMTVFVLFQVDFFCTSFEAGSYSVLQAGHKLRLLLPQPPRGSDK
jgi:hypothetical protein